jgi:serine/threonine protein kinase
VEIIDPEQRRQFLDEACGADQALREKVEQLLVLSQKSDEFFDACAPALAATPEDADQVLSAAESALDHEIPEPRQIGPYKLLQKLGEGGYGAVYMAEQEQPIRRRVALKIIKLGMDTRNVIARFEAERQALAMMEHPNIARVLDAGATETGRPYFVMELVYGVKITDYCDQNRVNMQERLELFIQVCNAVQHAHQKGVIHRDLKPSNIMVTMRDGVPVPKVIDFGIAKAIEQRLTDLTLFTSYAQLMGTPAYMSPEQMEFSGLNLDTRSDIYSLGVLLGVSKR